MKLVCTDLDRTLLPNGEQKESPLARPVLWHMLRTHDVLLAYVSGRDLQRVLDAIDEYQLQTPDAIVADVGTSIYFPADGQWEKSQAWIDTISADWNSASSSDIRAMLQEFDYLQDQDDSRQSAFKRSFYYPQSADESMLRESIGTVLQRNGVKAALVFSHDPERQVGLLDVLPQSATKGHAVACLQSVYQLSVDDVMFAGDSGNDVLAICAPNPGVLVANADQTTRDAVTAGIEGGALADTVCFAGGNLPVAGHENFNGHYAAGIVEGLVHFRPEWNACLQDADWVKQASDPART